MLADGFILLYLLLNFFVISFCQLDLRTAMQKAFEKQRLQHLHQPAQYSNEELMSFCQTGNKTRIDHYLDKILIPRVVGTPGHDQVAQFIETQLKSMEFDVEIHEFNQQTPIGMKTFRNIIGTENPNANRRFALVCHYDSKYFKDTEFLGATDSALPCALLLDVAAALRPLFSNKADNDLTLQLLFLDGEEAFATWTNTDSLYGSRALAEKWHAENRLDQLDAFVLLDLLGAANAQISNFARNFAQLYEQLPKTETELQETNGCMEPINSIFTTNTQSNVIQDDHIPFLRYGVPVVHIIPHRFPSVWHTPDDSRAALDTNTIHNLAAILRVFTAKNLGLHITAEQYNASLKVSPSSLLYFLILLSLLIFRCMTK